MRVASEATMMRLPHAPAALCGAAVEAGAVLPVLDLRAWLGGPVGCAGPVVYVRRAGQVIGLRVAAVERLSRDPVPLDLEGLGLPDFPDAPARIAAGRRLASPQLPPALPRGLSVIAGGQHAWLPATAVIRVIGDARALRVPWADPRAPAVLMYEGAAVDVVDLGRLLGAHAATAADGPLVLCLNGTALVALMADSVLGLQPRGDTRELSLSDLLRSLPGAGQPAPLPKPSHPSPAEPFLAVHLATQLCLLPLPRVRGVSPHERLAKLPSAPRGLIGARPVGGRILPVLDARPALGLPTGARHEADVWLDAPADCVLAVQQTLGVVRLPPGSLRPSPVGAVAAVARLASGPAWVLEPATLLQRATVG